MTGFFLKHLKKGGKFRPGYCLARHRVAFVIPYRNRLKNLNQFLFNMHPFLQRQEIGYNLFLVEQANDQLFNKGILMVYIIFKVLRLFSYRLTVFFACLIECCI